MPEDRPVLRLEQASVRFGGCEVLDKVQLDVRDREHWVIIGPNGAGKTTLLNLAAGMTHPSSGLVTILGHQVGATDLRSLRTMIGFAGPALMRRFRPTMKVLDLVMTGLDSVLETWWRDYSEAETLTCLKLLDELRLGHLAYREIRSLSTGELRKIQVARAILNGPKLLLLDEPASGLDIGAREQLVAFVDDLITGVNGPLASMTVTHHLDEIPPSSSHALLMSNGRVTVSGKINDVLTSEAMTHCFELELVVTRYRNRWSCVAAR